MSRPVLTCALLFSNSAQLRCLEQLSDLRLCSKLVESSVSGTTLSLSGISLRGCRVMNPGCIYVWAAGIVSCLVYIYSREASFPCTPTSSSARGYAGGKEYFWWGNNCFVVLEVKLFIQELRFTWPLSFIDYGAVAVHQAHYVLAERWTNWCEKKYVNCQVLLP